MDATHRVRRVWDDWPVTTRPRLELHRWAGATAVAGFVVFAVGNALWAFEQPAPDARGPEVVAFYAEASGRIVAGALLSLLSMAIFLVFAAALRRVMLEPGGHELEADAAFAGTVLGLAAGIGAETINMAAALRAGDDALSEPLALALFDVSYVLGSYGAGIGFGVLALALSTSSLRGLPLLPRWLAYAGLGVGAASISSLVALAVGEYAVAPVLLLVLVTGARLLRR